MACPSLRTDQQVAQSVLPQDHTYPPSSPPAQPESQTWAGYLRRVTRRDNTVGISKTWVKKGRTGSHGQVAGREQGSGEVIEA